MTRTLAHSDTPRVNPRPAGGRPQTAANTSRDQPGPAGTSRGQQPAGASSQQGPAKTALAENRSQESATTRPPAPDPRARNHGDRKCDGCFETRKEITKHGGWRGVRCDIVAGVKHKQVRSQSHRHTVTRHSLAACLSIGSGQCSCHRVDLFPVCCQHCQLPIRLLSPSPSGVTSWFPLA